MIIPLIEFANRGGHHDRLSSHSRQSEVFTQGVVVTKSTRGRHRGLSSPSRQKVVTQLTEGIAITKSTRRGCRHQADKRSSHSRPKGTPSQPKERGHQVNPRR
jgi:hypothetical protein